MILKIIQCALVTHICLDIGISHIEKNNKPKAFDYFMLWFIYVITLIAM